MTAVLYVFAAFGGIAMFTGLVLMGAAWREASVDRRITNLGRPAGCDQLDVDQVIAEAEDIARDAAR